MGPASMVHDCLSGAAGAPLHSMKISPHSPAMPLNPALATGSELSTPDPFTSWRRPSRMMRMVSFALVWALIAPAAADQAYFHGAMGDRTGFSVQIDPLTQGASGNVIYDSSGQDGLSVAVTRGSRNAFEWKESLYSRADGQTRDTGRFTGTLSADGKTAQGQWTAADGRKTLPFRLDRWARIHRLPGSDKEVWVSYPEFDAPGLAALNTQLAAQAKQQLQMNRDWSQQQRKENRGAGMPAEVVAAISRSNDCDVEWSRSDLVSLGCREYEYAGGAHPNTEFYSENYALDGGGKPRKLALKDIVQTSPAAMAQLSRLLVEDLRRQQASSIIDGSIKGFSKELDANGIPFTLLPGGLAFQFSPYVVGSYAEGSFRVVIPYRKIAALLRANGPVKPPG